MSVCVCCQPFVTSWRACTENSGVWRGDVDVSLDPIRQFCNDGIVILFLPLSLLSCNILCADSPSPLSPAESHPFPVAAAAAPPSGCEWVGGSWTFSSSSAPKSSRPCKDSDRHCGRLVCFYSVCVCAFVRALDDCVTCDTLPSGSCSLLL